MSELTVNLIVSENITPEEKRELTEAGKYLTIFGGDRSNPTWDEYLENADADVRPYFLIIKEWVLGLPTLPCGDELNIFHFKFSDGMHIGFTWRAWGDFVQAVVGKHEGYMKYYMRSMFEDYEEALKAINRKPDEKIAALHAYLEDVQRNKKD